MPLPDCTNLIIIQHFTTGREKCPAPKQEPVAATNGVEVDVIFHEPGENDASFVSARKQEPDRMKKGLRLGGGHYYRSRDELHER